MSGVDLVVVGHVTLDRIGGDTAPGGSAYYATWTAHRLGLRAALVTSFAADYPVSALPPDLAVVNVGAPVTTVYEIEEAPGRRTLRLAARAEDLREADVPRAWRSAPLTFLCPVAGEVPPGLAAAFPEGSVGVAPQGWLRRRGGDGTIEPEAWDAAPAVLPHVQWLAVSEEDVAPFKQAALEWVQRVPVAAITRGGQGATLFVNGEPYHVQADAATEVSTIGAGDVFATAFLVEYHRRGDPWEAAAAAACAAAASVEALGPAGIPDREALDRRLATYRRRWGG